MTAAASGGIALELPQLSLECAVTPLDDQQVHWLCSVVARVHRTVDAVVVVFMQSSDATALSQGAFALPAAVFYLCVCNLRPSGLLLEVVRFEVGAARPGQHVYVRIVRLQRPAPASLHRLRRLHVVPPPCSAFVWSSSKHCAVPNCDNHAYYY